MNALPAGKSRGYSREIASTTLLGNKSVGSDNISSVLPDDSFEETEYNVDVRESNTPVPKASLSSDIATHLPSKIFSMALLPPASKLKVVKNSATQVTDIDILLSTLGHPDLLSDRCVSYTEDERTREYLEDSAPSVNTRPSPCSRDSEPLPTRKNSSYWMDFLHCVFPKVECSQLLHFYQMYGLRNTVDILFEKKELLILSDCIIPGAFESQQIAAGGSNRPKSPPCPKKIQSAKMDFTRQATEDLVAVDISSLQLVLSEEFGETFPNLIKLPRSVLRSIIEQAEFYTEEALHERQLARDHALARDMEDAEKKDLERQRASEQTARLFPDARNESFVVSGPGYQVVGSSAPTKPTTNSKVSINSALTLDEAQNMATIYINDAEALENDIKQLQLKADSAGKIPATLYYREKISKLVKKKIELRENADTLIRDANNGSGCPNVIDLHCMSLEGARKFAKEYIKVNYHPRKKIRIITGHGNGGSVIRSRVLNDLKNGVPNKWIVDSSSNAGELAITFI